MTAVVRRRVALIAALAAAYAIAPLHAQNRDFIWRAARGQSVVYLVGSVHLLSKDYYPLSPALDKAFKECDLLVEELHLGEMAEVESQMMILMRGMLPSGQTLDKVVTPADLRARQRPREGARPADRTAEPVQAVGTRAHLAGPGMASGRV